MRRGNMLTMLAGVGIGAAAMGMMRGRNNNNSMMGNMMSSMLKGKNEMNTMNTDDVTDTVQNTID